MNYLILSNYFNLTILFKMEEILVEYFAIEQISKIIISTQTIVIGENFHKNFEVVLIFSQNSGIDPKIISFETFEEADKWVKDFIHLHGYQEILLNIHK